MIKVEPANDPQTVEDAIFFFKYLSSFFIFFMFHAAWLVIIFLFVDLFRRPLLLLLFFFLLIYSIVYNTLASLHRWHCLIWLILFFSFSLLLIRLLTSLLLSFILQGISFRSLHSVKEIWFIFACLFLIFLVARFLFISITSFVHAPFFTTNIFLYLALSLQSFWIHFYSFSLSLSPFLFFFSA